MTKGNSTSSAKTIGANTTTINIGTRRALNSDDIAGTVVHRHTDVHATDVLDDGTEFEVVYTPVVIRVDTVHKGVLKKDAEVAVRSMGGTADGVQYALEEAPAKKTFAKGTSLVVFGS